MCRRVGLAACFAVAAAMMATPAMASAQEVGRLTEAELLERIDSLAPIVAMERERLERAMEQREAVERAYAIQQVDTLRFGEIRVITPKDRSDEVGEIVREVLDEDFPGIEHRRGFALQWFVAQWETPFENIYTDAPPKRARAGMLASRARMRAAVREMLEAGLFDELIFANAEAADWGVSGGIGEPEALAQWVYTDLATTPSQLVPPCLEGELDACWSLLGLDLPENPLPVWYSQDERRALVGRVARWRGDREIQEARGLCLDGSVYAACDRVIESDPYLPVDPLESGSRTLMLGLALEAGGPNAWSRLLEVNDRPLGEALRYASGLETEELAQRWLDVARTGRPEVHAGLGGLQLFTMLWIGVLTALTMRSTRWRLG